MKRDEVALQIFVKRLPNEPLNDKSKAWFLSRASEAFELAELFVEAQNRPAVILEPLPEPSGLELEKDEV